MDEPEWLTEELIRVLHDRQLAEHGGSPGICDEGMLESALARLRQQYAYGGEAVDMASLAAAYAYGLSRNHAFMDGNKRTAAVACELFLELNGYRLVARDEDLYPVFMALAASELEEDELVAWLRENVRPDRVSEEAGEYARS